VIAREELERELRALAASLEWPPEPDLTGRVRDRIGPPAEAQGADPSPRDSDRGRAPTPWRRARRAPTWVPRGLRSPLGAAAVALLALLVATALVPPARSAVLRVLGLTHSARIVRAPGPPTVTRAPLDLGRPLPLADARRRLAFRIRFPAALAPPARVRYSSRIAGGAVTLSWPRGEALTEFQGAGTPFLEKFAQESTRVRRVSVGETFGYFLSGAPHVVVVLDRNGAPVQGTRALVRGNVLLWDAGGIAFRLETRRGLRGALALARSVR
jgi:hypothetical protein